MMMAQDLLQSDSQSPVAAQSSCTFSNMKAKSLRLECAYVENEIKHMLHISNSSSQSLSEDCDSFEIPSRTSELSTTRSLKDEGTALLFDKEGRHRSKREHCKGCSSTRSIPKTAQDLFDNEDGRSCAAARDHSECHTKESSFGWDIHGTTVKKKCLPTRVRVPPLDIPGNKSTGAEIPSSFDMQHASMHNAHRNAYNNEHWEDDGALRNRIEDDEQLLRKKKKKKHKQKQEWASNVMRRKNRVLNKRQAEREDITKSQNDIMKTLHSLKANMGYLLGLQERSRSKHLDTS